jgi:dienelactone hydrolase
MLRFIRYVTASLVAGLVLPALAQTGIGTFGLDAAEHGVGFQLFEEQDHSRIVSGGVRGTTHPRPIRTYLWYPAETTRRSRPLRFRNYAALADGDVWPAEISGELRTRLQYANGPLARSLSTASYEALLARPMRAVENAKPADGPFPLLVIGLGLYYESPITFATWAEYLAGHGFVVATAPLVGTQIAITRVVVVDLETQIRDLEVVIARARQLSFVDAERLGVLGFDQGGMAGVVLTMRNRDVDAFVSLDSGIQFPHPSGLPRSSPHYDALALRVPWLHVAAPRNDGPPGADRQALYDEAVYADRYWLRAELLGHADFTSYALVEGRGEVIGYWEAVTPARTASHRAVAEFVGHFFAAHLKSSAASTAFLAQDVRQTFPGAGLTLEHHSATLAPVGYDELVQKIISGRTDEAIAELRSLASSSPDDALLTEASLGRLCVSLLYTWNLAQQALPLVDFSLELYPSSGGGKALLAETQIALRNYPAAIAAYEELAAQFPGDASLASRLEWLRSQR